MIGAVQRFDVAIIGGGLMGCAAALGLRERGRSVVLFEQGWCGAQASGVNYGGVRRQGRAIVQLPLAQRAHGLWQTLSTRLDRDIEYLRTGHLKLALDAAGVAELARYRDASAEYGLGLQLLDAADVRARFPGLSSAVLGASLCPDDGQANPRLLAAAFARAARVAGAVVREQCRVTRIVSEDSAQSDSASVELAETAPAAGGQKRHASGRFTVYADAVPGLGDPAHSGVVEARYVLNCAGAWGATFAEQCGDVVPLAPIYPNMLVTEPLPPIMSINVGIVGGAFYARQVTRGNVVIGGGRSEGVLALSGSRPDGVRAAQAFQAAERTIPGLRGALVIRSWTGVEGATPDKQPILGMSPTTPGLLHAFGFSGGGFQLSPAVGEVLAEWVTDGGTTTPVEAFRVNRFFLPMRC
jgi:sarcosine oxidase subunit beta